MKHFLLCLALLTSALLGAVSQLDSKARWIWYPEEFGAKTTNASRFARITFDWKKAQIQRAQFHYRADDRAVVWINGTKLTDKDRVGSHSIGYNLAPYLVDGKNVLCVEIQNGSGPGGLIGHFWASAPGKPKLHIFTNKDWRILQTAEEGWLTANFDDSKAAIPQDMGNSLTPPWSDTFGVIELYDEKEMEIYESEKQSTDKIMNDLRDKFTAEPELNVAIDVQPGTNPKVLINGKAMDFLMYGAPYAWPYDVQKTADKIKNFREAGINLMFLGVEIDGIWNSDGSINTKQITERLEKALFLNPDAYLCLAVNCSGAPGWWYTQNPDELIDYANGGVNPKAGDPVDNVQRPSYASLKWRKDVAEALQKVVKHVESIPAGKRVFSYRMDFGVYREWHYFGMRSGMPGNCKCMQSAFRNYLKEKYKTAEALQKAWNDKNVTFETATIPTKDERNASIGGGMTLRDPVAQVRVIDFLHCMQCEMRDLVIALNTAVKEACGYRKLCGNYHGYLFGMHYPVEAWHLENEATLDSKAVDWQSSPNLYSNREVDDAEMGRAPVESYILRGKVNVQEHDSRTYLAVEEGYHRHANTAEQSVTILARDFAQSLCRNAGCWFMDFARHWYNDPKIFAFFRKIEPIRALATDNASVAEVAIIADLESVYYNRINTTDIDLLLDANVQEWTHCATPFDVLLVNDLKNPKVRDYKVYVIANMVYVTPEKEALIRKLQEAGKTIVWLYAPGYLTPAGHSAADIQKLTGFAVKEAFVPQDGRAVQLNGREMVPMSRYRMNPSFAIDDKAAQVLGYRKADKTEVTFASKKSGNSMAYYSTTGFLSRDAWKAIFKAGGVHCYENSGTAVVWASNSFISINGKQGKYTLTLPRPRKVTQLLPDKVEGSGKPEKTIEVELTDAVGIKLYYLE